MQQQGYRSYPPTAHQQQHRRAPPGPGAQNQPQSFLAANPPVTNPLFATMMQAPGKPIRLADIQATFARSGPMVPNANQPQFGGMHPQQFTQNQQNEQMRQREAAAELAKRRSTRPVERDIPDGVDEIVAGLHSDDPVARYKSLRDAEKRLDAIMMRKRLDIQDSVARHPRVFGTLRIWISNTVENQPWQDSGMDPHAFDFSSNVEATFKMKIEGRLLDGDKDASSNSASGTADSQSNTADEDGERAAKRPKLLPQGKPRKKLSHFFKAITVDFDRSRSLQPDGFTKIEWKRPEVPMSHMDPPKEADFDCLEFERKSDENINVTINLVRDEKPERYKLAQPLAELLDMEEAERKTVMVGLYEYIRTQGLQHEDDMKRVNCDARLRDMFGLDQFQYHHLPEMIRRLMSDLPPISLPYTIRVDKAFHSSDTPVPTIYDIPVPLDDPLRAQMLSMTQAPDHMAALKTIAGMDDQLALIVQKMNEAKAKHDFYTSMSKDPANFVRRWISSQQRDLEVILGSGPWADSDWQSAEWRRGGAQGPWGTDEAWEGVGSFLSRQR